MKSLVTAMFVLAMATSSLVAQDQEKKCEKCPASATAKKACANCPASATATVSTKCDGCTESSCGSGCAVTQAMAKLPKMTYKVGKHMTCCSKTAGELAKKNESAIHYMVGEKKFEKENEAFTALVTETESFVNNFVTAKKCSVSGTTTIAGKKCECSCEAGKRTELVSAAIKDIKMSYMVGKESACCPASAQALAKKHGEKVTFVVAGKETCCNHTARLNLAKAKYEAAVKALVAAEKTAEKTETKTEKKG